MAGTQVFMDNQRSIIVRELSAATSSVQIAMEYFTDASVFNLLVKKAKEGVRVSLMVRDDEINTMTGIDYAVLKDMKGDFCYKKRLNQKFCLIDSSKILTGSCNWTYDGMRNHEDLVVIIGDTYAIGLYQTVFHKINDPVRHNLQMVAIREKWANRRKEKMNKQEDININKNTETSTFLNSNPMGQYKHLLYSDNINSIATTIKSIIKPLREYGFTGTRDKTEVLSAFMILLGQRAQAAMMSNVTEGNYLLDTGMNVINGMYEECFVVDTDKYKLDLTLFVSAAMFLESSIKREDLKKADSNFKQEYFECIYNICKQSYPEQVLFTSAEAIDSMNKLNRFLLQRYSR